jgi:hypothetical protein
MTMIAVCAGGIGTMTMTGEDAPGTGTMITTMMMTTIVAGAGGTGMTMIVAGADGSPGGAATTVGGIATRYAAASWSRTAMSS